MQQCRYLPAVHVQQHAAADKNKPDMYVICNTYTKTVKFPDNKFLKHVAIVYFAAL